ncbi:MAG: hypothetical protein JRF47_00605 [Deltaproteobacteria bacterium]|jgi:hypothetical protein|nr:hypothetical protein [Deltaproteobacteria bacterium]MBW2581989.1 hypothetical protein [Deltaproteobacteria bacterium]MBW2656579.1 hypothetical protein [Deltaproteobacteria bacterium]
MNLEIFKKMDSDQLFSYLEFLLKNYRIVDSFWFIAVEDKFGRQAAEKLNAEVWERAGVQAIKDLKQRFDIREKGLEGLFKALKLFPWTSIGGHQLEKKENEIILSVPRCPPQVARLKRGLGEYDCKDMHRKEFVQTAKEIDPLIRVDCDFAPPDPHPEDLFCRWRFVL